MTNLPYPYKVKDGRFFVNKTKEEVRKKKADRFGIEIDKKIIGMIGLESLNLKEKNAELGYWLGKKHWRKGIVSEAAKLILNYGFKDLKLVRIYARVFHQNKPSYRLLEKIGFKPEGTLRKHIKKNGKYYDELRYGLLKEEFKRK